MLVYLNRAAPNFHINAAGSDYSENGAPEDCPGPGNYSPQHVPAALAPAVLFPGTVDEGFDRSGSDVGVTDTQALSVSLWLRRDTAGRERVMFSAGASIFAELQADGSFFVSFQNTLGAGGFGFSLAAGLLPGDSVWRHLCFYCNLAVADDHLILLNGVDVTPGSVTHTVGETFNHTVSGFALGAQVGLGGVRHLAAALSQLGFWNRKIDWGVPGDLALVYDGGKAVLLPDDGDIDGNGAADYVFNKALATAHVNGGNANNWAAATSGLSDTAGPAI